MVEDCVEPLRRRSLRALRAPEALERPGPRPPPALAHAGGAGRARRCRCPSRWAGIGGSTRDVGDAIQVLARGLVLEPLIEGAVIAGAVLQAGEGAAAALADASTGEVLFILVGGRHGDLLQCAERGDGFVLSGRARVVPGAGQADRWLVAADDEAGCRRVLQVSPQGGGRHRARLPHDGRPAGGRRRLRHGGRFAA